MALSNPPKFLIKPSGHFRSQVSSRSHIGKTIENIKSKLTSDQQEMFRSTRFGQFLDLDVTFNGQLIHYLLLREVEEDRDSCISFMIGGEVCTFGRSEFDMVTGLWCSHSNSTFQPNVNRRLRKKFFQDKSTVYASELENIFLKYEGDDEDGVKLAILYLLELGLLGKEKKLKVDTMLWGIVDDWPTFNSYDWGSLIFERTILGLKKALIMAKEKRKGTMDRYTIVGFPHALQIWAYEIIATIDGCVAKKISDDAIPRMLRWSCTQSPSAEILQGQVFDLQKMKIKAFLEPTEEERLFKDVARGEQVSQSHPCKLGINDSLGQTSNMPIEDEVPAKRSKKKRSGSKRKHKSKSMTSKEYMDLNERVTKLEHGMERMTSKLEHGIRRSTPSMTSKEYMDLLQT